MRFNKGITYNRVRELFDYHKDGYLTYKITRGNKIKGSIAGCIRDDNYSVIRIDYIKYQLHIIIFLWYHGYIPENEIDHKDRDETNNRIENLRDVSHQCNSRNRGISKNNTSGVTGVSFISKSRKWLSTITINRKNFGLGLFTNFDDAVKARHEKEIDLNWNGCNSTSPSYIYLKEHNLI